MEAEVAELHGGPLSVRTSLFGNIEKGLIKNANGLATISMHQPADHLAALVGDLEYSSLDQSIQPGCLKWTYSQIHRAALKFAAALMAQGIQPGMRIATLFPNRVEWPLTLWMTTILRLTLCSLDPGVLNLPRREELASLMTMLQPEVVFVLDEKAAQAIDEALRQNTALDIRRPKVRIILEEVPGSNTGDWISFQRFVSTAALTAEEREKLLRAAREDDPDRDAMIVFTSGTSSGKPKGCPRHVHSSCHGLFSQIYGVNGFNQKSRILQSSANFRIIAPSITMHAWQNGAATVIPDPALGTKGTIAAIRKHRVTFVLLIPALLHALVAEPEFHGDLDLSSITDVQLGGEITTRDVFKKAVRSFPSAKVCNGHGMSEGGGIFNWCFGDVDPANIPFINDICPLGRVAHGARVRIQDPEDPHGKVMRRGEVGELVLSCDSIIKSYLGNVFLETFFTEPKTGIRWFRTGDLAMISPNGIVYIVGRAKDRIKRAGIPILPAALENCIEIFTGSQTAVLAYPHPTLGQEPLAVMRDLSGKSEMEIQEHVISKFGRDYALGPVVSLEQLGLARFPLNATGKVMKLQLLKRAQEILSR